MHKTSESYQRLLNDNAVNVVKMEVRLQETTVKLN